MVFDLDLVLKSVLEPTGIWMVWHEVIIFATEQN